MALISEWMEPCGKKVLDNAGIVREAMFRQPVDEQATSVDSSTVSINNCRVMRMLQCVLLIAACTNPLVARGAAKFGYVHCSSGEEQLPTLVYSDPNPPFSIPVGSLKCGEKVRVLGREGPWLKIALVGSDERYIAVRAISQRKDRFVALDLPAPPEPIESRPKTGKVRPRSIYSPNPEYTQEALNAGIHGMVILTLTVGADGLARDVKVVVGLGYGLDEKAVKAVQSWKFEPALQDGVPIEFRCAVEVSFPPGK